MRAKQHNLLAGGIIAGAMFAMACGPDLPPTPDRADIDAFNELLPDPVTGQITFADSGLLNRLLALRPSHAGPPPARSHVQCFFLRNIRTRATVALGPPDEDGPSGEICSVRGNWRRGKSDLKEGAYIATVRIDAPIVVGDPRQDVPHLGMTPGRNTIVVTQIGDGCKARVLNSQDIVTEVPCRLVDYPPGHGRNAFDIAVWRDNATTACVACFRNGWCEIGE